RVQIGRNVKPLLTGRPTPAPPTPRAPPRPPPPPPPPPRRPPPPRPRAPPPPAPGAARLPRAPRPAPPGGRRTTHPPPPRGADCEPDDFDLRTVPERLARLGDPHAGIDDHPWDITPLLEWAERDARNGEGDLPYPPEHPKMPGEPKRVQPSRDADRPR